MAKCDFVNAITTSEDVVEMLAPDFCKNANQLAMLESQIHEKDLVFITKELLFKHIGYCAITMMNSSNQQS
jgi:hypothetical protein